MADSRWRGLDELSRWDGRRVSDGQRREALHAGASWMVERRLDPSSRFAALPHRLTTDGGECDDSRNQ